MTVQESEVFEKNISIPNARKRRKRRNFKAYRAYALNDLEAVMKYNAPTHQHLLARLWPLDKFYTEPASANEQETNDKAHTDIQEQPEQENTQSGELTDEQLIALDGYFYFHITSRIHLSKRLLSKDEVKDILKTQCLHYSRACKIALLNYCILEDHLHLLIGIKSEAFQDARAKAAKMIGCIKQQFTKRYKHWHENIYRVQRKFRIKRLTKGTMWDGRALIEYLADEAELLACTLYVETNHIKIAAANHIKTLESPPEPVAIQTNTAAIQCLNTNYQPVLEKLKNYNFQSAGWYLNAQKGHKSALSDGMDGNWATEAELKIWWDVPVNKYPPGWRKVWFKEGGGILKITPDSARRYARHPSFEILGETNLKRAHALGHFLLAVCWHNRTNVWARPAPGQEEPGANEV